MENEWNGGKGFRLIVMCIFLNSSLGDIREHGALACTQIRRGGFFFSCWLYEGVTHYRVKKNLFDGLFYK